MKPGDAIVLTEGIRFSINSTTDMTDMDLDRGLPGVVVSKANPHGFCRVQIDLSERVHITTSIHKNQITKRGKI